MKTGTKQLKRAMRNVSRGLSRNSAAKLLHSIRGKYGSKGAREGLKKHES